MGRGFTSFCTLDTPYWTVTAGRPAASAATNVVVFVDAGGGGTSNGVEIVVAVVGACVCVRIVEKGSRSSRSGVIPAAVPAVVAAVSVSCCRWCRSLGRRVSVSPSRHLHSRPGLRLSNWRAGKSIRVRSIGFPSPAPRCAVDDRWSHGRECSSEFFFFFFREGQNVIKLNGMRSKLIRYVACYISFRLLFTVLLRFAMHFSGRGGFDVF